MTDVFFLSQSFRVADVDAKASCVTVHRPVHFRYTKDKVRGLCWIYHWVDAELKVHLMGQSELDYDYICHYRIILMGS